MLLASLTIKSRHQQQETEGVMEDRASQGGLSSANRSIPATYVLFSRSFMGVLHGEMQLYGRLLSRVSSHRSAPVQGYLCAAA